MTQQREELEKDAFPFIKRIDLKVACSDAVSWIPINEFIRGDIQLHISQSNHVTFDDGSMKALLQHLEGNKTILIVPGNHDIRAEEGAQPASVKPATFERLSRLARLCMSAKAHERFVWPAIQDLRVEYEDIKRSGDTLRAKWVLVRGYASVIPHWLYGLVARVLERVFSA